MNQCAALVDLLLARVDDTGAWSISSEEVQATLAASPVAFWRAVHALRGRIAFSDAIDGFTQDTVGDLVTLLEEMGHAAAEGALSHAGLFIPHGSGVELTEEFLSAAALFCAAHTIRSDELEAMIRHAGTVRGAIAIYLGEYLDREALIEESAERFQSGRGRPDAARATAARYLRGLFTRHILDPRHIASGLEARLTLAAAAMGYVDPEERAGRGRGRTRVGGESRGAVRRRGGHAWAAGVMGIEEESLDPGVLRTRYRLLMMQHHPDVDPGGLELCKDINAAYSILMGETGGVV